MGSRQEILDLFERRAMSPEFVVGGSHCHDRAGDRRKNVSRAVAEHRLDGRRDHMRTSRQDDLAGGHLDDSGPRRPFLIFIPGRRIVAGPVGKIGRHRRQDLRRLIE